MNVQPSVSTSSSSVAPSMPVASVSAFAALGLAPALLRAVADEGYATPTPIQAMAIPPVLRGRDLLGCAQTGTGKTAAFVLPLLQRLASGGRRGRVRALVLTPTRELAAQIAERVTAYGRHQGVRHAVVYGGVSQRAQEHALRRSPDVLVATPGRLLDLMNQGIVNLGGVEIFVLDEADRMLDMGFVHDVKRVVAALPPVRQTLFFSATMPRSIEDLAAGLLKDPERVAVAPQGSTVDRVMQSVYFVGKGEKRALLERVLRGPDVVRALVFTRTKHGANRVTEQLEGAGIGAAAIHGNKSQGQRERALLGFRQGTTAVLVATDIAARGIDVDGVSHVINYDLPDAAESYVHRIGRTGRAGASGHALSFVEGDERRMLRDIERLIRKPIAVAGGEPARTEDQRPSAASGREETGRGQGPRRYRGLRVR